MTPSIVVDTNSDVGEGRDAMPPLRSLPRRLVGVADCEEFSAADICDGFHVQCAYAAVSKNAKSQRSPV
jgi:hypothetical protein